MNSPEIMAAAKARARSCSDASSITPPTALEAALSESIDVGGSLGSEDEAITIIGKYRSLLYMATGTWLAQQNRLLCALDSLFLSPSLSHVPAPLRLLIKQMYAIESRLILVFIFVGAN